jgi:hypothetical protein
MPGVSKLEELMRRKAERVANYVANQTSHTE